MLEQQIPKGTKRVRARGGKSRGRAGGWGRTLLLLSCLLAWSSVSKIPVHQVLIVMWVYLTVLFD